VVNFRDKLSDKTVGKLFQMDVTCRDKAGNKLRTVTEFLTSAYDLIAKDQLISSARALTDKELDHDIPELVLSVSTQYGWISCDSDGVLCIPIPRWRPVDRIRPVQLWQIAVEHDFEGWFKGQLRYRRRIWQSKKPLKANHGRKGYREECNKWMKRHGYETLEQASKHLAISIDVLKSIRTDKGKKRYGDDPAPESFNGIREVTYSLCWSLQLTFSKFPLQAIDLYTLIFASLFTSSLSRSLLTVVVWTR
jgi:hypothetical protein